MLLEGNYEPMSIDDEAQLLQQDRAERLKANRSGISVYAGRRAKRARRPRRVSQQFDD